ncbi:hypothetical protein Tco_0824388 [Tanacetum coccineum]|uniref:CCHC-type domain-containing protein n=1 Tax=Tanacetum coccineum TaxID=301880 RepID=A0ABQ5AQL6_9ASTR
MPNTRSGASMTHEEVEELVTHRVGEEMEAREAARTLEPLNENVDEQEGENGGNGNGGNGNRGNGENGNGNRNGNHGMNYGGFMLVASREHFSKTFLECKPHKFLRKTEGVDNALTWWNSHKRTIGVEAAYAMNWVELMKLMIEVYCPRNEIQKMRLNWQPPDVEAKNTSGKNVARAYTSGNNERKGYAGLLPYCNKCRLHHEGLCTIRCGNCKNVGHQTRDCRTAIAPNTQRAPVGN